MTYMQNNEAASMLCCLLIIFFIFLAPLSAGHEVGALAIMMMLFLLAVYVGIIVAICFCCGCCCFKRAPEPLQQVQVIHMGAPVLQNVPRQSGIIVAPQAGSRRASYVVEGQAVTATC